MQHQHENYLENKQLPSEINTRFFHQLFEEIVDDKAQHDSDDLAIIFQGEVWSYRKLNKQVNRLAHYLIALKKNNKWPDGTCIALLFVNSPEAIISILAVMKAGLSWLPLTPGKRLSNQFLLHYYIEA